MKCNWTVYYYFLYIVFVALIISTFQFKASSYCLLCVSAGHWKTSWIVLACMTKCNCYSVVSISLT